MPKFKGKYGVLSQEKRKNRIQGVASIEEFSSAVQISAGLRSALKAKDASALEALRGPATPTTEMKVREQFIDYVVSGVISVLDLGKIFFSPEPDVALAELRNLLATDEVAGPIVRELTRIRKDEEDVAEAENAYAEYQAEIDAGNTPDPAKYAKYRLGDEE